MTVGGPVSPSIPGLRLRPGTVADWDAVAGVFNRARAADGIDETRTGAELVAEYGALESFELPRDLLVAELDGRVVGFVLGYRVVRDGILVGETWGGVEPALRGRGLGTALWRTTRDRLAREMDADPRPGPRELRTFALDSERADLALFAAQGYASVRFGFEMRRFLTGSLPEHALPEGLELRPVSEDQHRAIFDADNEAFEDHWGHRPATEGDFVARFDGPGRRHLAVVRGLGRRRGGGRGDEHDLPVREPAAGDPPRVARPRLGAPSLARTRRGEGAVREVVPGPARAGHGRCLAGRRRRQPDRRPPAVRGARVQGGPPLAGVRAPGGPAGATRLAIGRARDERLTIGCLALATRSG